MKKISFKKAIIILSIITLISLLAITLMIYLTKEPETNKEIVLPKPKDEIIVDNSSDDSTKEEISRIEQFSYDINLTVLTTETVSKEYDWVEKNHNKIIFNDNSSLYLNQNVVNNHYTISNEKNNILKIETYYKDYILKFKKINSTPYKNVTCFNTTDTSEELINEYIEIKNEYKELKSTNSEEFYKYKELGNYPKMINFIENNGLQKDIGLYTSNQIKEIIEKTLDVTIDNDYCVDKTVLFKNNDIISCRFEKTQSMPDKPNYVIMECYYLISDGTNIYVCSLTYNLDVFSEIDFTNEVLFYLTNSPQLY